MKSNKTCTFKVVCCSVTILSLITIAAICLGVGSYGIIYANRNRMRFQSNNGYTEPLSTTLSEIVSTSLGVLTTSTRSNFNSGTTTNENIPVETSTNSVGSSTVFISTTSVISSSSNAFSENTTEDEQEIVTTSTVQELTNTSSSSSSSSTSISTTIPIEPTTNNDNISTIEPLQNCIVNDEFHPEGSPTREGWIPICEGDDGCVFSGPNNNCICPENFC